MNKKIKSLMAVLMIAYSVFTLKLYGAWGVDTVRDGGSYCDVFINNRPTDFEWAVTRYNTVMTSGANSGYRDGCSKGIVLMPHGESDTRVSTAMSPLVLPVSNGLYFSSKPEYNSWGTAVRQCDSINSSRYWGGVNYERQYCHNASDGRPNRDLVVIDVSHYNGDDSCPIKVQANAKMYFLDVTIKVKPGTDLEKVICKAERNSMGEYVRVDRNVLLAGSRQTPLSGVSTSTSNVHAYIYNINVVYNNDLPGSGGMNGSGGMDGSGGMSGSGGGTGGSSGSGGMDGSGGMVGSGGMSGSGGGSGGMSGSGGGGGGLPTNAPTGSFTFEAGMGNAVTIRWRAVNGRAYLSGGGLNGSQQINTANAMGEIPTTGTVSDVPVRRTRYVLTVRPMSGPDFTYTDEYNPPAIADPTIDFSYSINTAAPGFLLRWTIQNSNSRTLTGPGLTPTAIDATSTGRPVTAEGLYTIIANGVLNSKTVSLYVSQTTAQGGVGPAPQCTLNRVDTAAGADFTWSTVNATRVSFGKLGVTPAEDTNANRTTALSKRNPTVGVDTYVLSAEGANGQSCKVYSLLLPPSEADAAHPDPDGDGICNIKLNPTPATCHYFGPNEAIDNCPAVPNTTQANGDHDFKGDDCDPNPNTIDFPNQFGSADGGCSCNLSAASNEGWSDNWSLIFVLASTLFLIVFAKKTQQKVKIGR